mgnify:CR=1 FL=1
MNNNSDSTLIIDLKKLQQNYKIIQKRTPKSEVWAVVKANAYGLGVNQVANALIKSGCNTFFVATLDEGLELRNITKKSTIYVFHGVRGGQEKLFYNNKIVPILNDIGDIGVWKKFATTCNKKLPAAIHIDTGMNRLGFGLDDAMETQSFKLEFMMSHLACADDKDHPKNKEQLINFNRARKLFPGIKYSFANSAGIFSDKCYHFDIVRPGCSLYGVNPTKSQKNPVNNVIKLNSKIIQIRKLTKQETIGYGATAKLKSGSKIAVIPVGYADGYLRALSNHSYCYIDNIKTPVIGRISMDLITIDVTSLPDNKLYIGKEVELIGEKITVDDLANNAKTIGYEILTRLGSRFKRVYLNNE